MLSFFSNFPFSITIPPPNALFDLQVTLYTLNPNKTNEGFVYYKYVLTKKHPITMITENITNISLPVSIGKHTNGII